jgi:hypothetical protein
MNRLRRLLVPSTVVCALALALAATASAEVRTGEGSSAANPGIPGEADLLHASASYDSHTGTVVFDATAREAPGPDPKAIPRAVLFTVKGACDASVPGSAEPLLPTLSIGRAYEEVESRWMVGWAGADAAGEPLSPGLGSWSLEGTTGTLAATIEPAVGQPYNCALVELAAPSDHLLQSGEYTFLPLSVPKPAEPVKTTPAEPVVKTVTVTASAPPSAPGKLEFAKTKALSAKSGGWTKASVKITNAGGTAVGPIGIKATGPAGVKIQPAQMKVPALLPSQTWTVSFRVKPAADAKSSSTITLTGTGPGLTAKGSLLVKSAG